MINNNIAKTPKQVLVAAKWILENVGWCQGQYFLDAQDHVISLLDVLSDRLVPAKCCLTGAIDIVKADKADPFLKLAALALIYNKTGVGAISFNDSHSFEEVIEMLDAIINGNTL